MGNASRAWCQWMGTLAFVLTGCASPGSGSASAPARTAGYAVQGAALTAADATTDAAAKGKLPILPQSRVSHEIESHRKWKVEAATLDPRERTELLRAHGLEPRLDAESCAIYVKTRWTDQEIDALGRDGIYVNRGLFVPPVPAHRHFWGYHVTTVPYTQMARFETDPNVVRVVSLEHPVELHNDLSRIATHVDEVQKGIGVTSRTGAGVKVCIADSGVDLWSTDLSAPQEALNMTSGDSLATWDNDVANYKTDHGTHVTGIVVGNGGHSAGKYKGGAPNAKWYFYRVGDNGGDIADADILEAMDRSKTVGCQVFSASIGSVGYELDGSDPLSQMVDSMTATGMAVFVAAGNNGQSKSHLSAAIAPGETKSFTVTYKNESGLNVPMTAFLHAYWRDDTPGDANLDLSSSGANLDSWTMEDHLSLSPRNTESSTIRLNSVAVTDGGSAQWTVSVSNKAAGDATTVHLFVLGNVGGRSIRFDAPTTDATINTPALADTAMAVGSWTTRTYWQDAFGVLQPPPSIVFPEGEVSPFSSRGPRIDGVMKPDLVAPGAFIVSLADGDFTYTGGASMWLIDDDGQNLDGSGPAHYRTMDGTSMACPAAAAGHALLREAYPNENAYNLNVRLMQTASNAATPNNDIGYGLINVKAAILANECGNGAVEGNEECDDGNTTGGDCCSIICKWDVLCNDGNACTVEDYCDASHQCQSGSPKKCDDAKDCTTDGCAPATGCTHTPILAGPCDDGNKCTNDSCSFGTCVGILKFCFDGNACTDDACNPNTGSCAFTNNFTPCDDGVFCTVNDYCSGGACTGGGVNPCDDGDKCTADSCQAWGCDHQQVYIACDDGDACTMYDNCNSLGICKGAEISCFDGNLCTTDACTGGKCVFSQMVCDDGDPCTDDQCYPQLGFCNSSPKSCLDTNDCTADACNTKTGVCEHTALDGTSCLDPYWCTKADTCVAGTCVGTPVVCKDGDPCTDDLCDENTGQCWFKSNTAPCSDSNPCTEGDACYGGTCTAGTAKVCSDGNPCTFDKCDKAQGGCVYELPFASFPPCDDGEPCTTDDYCVNGACISGVPTFCDDGDPCTIDSCKQGVGCKSVSGGNDCDDGNPCTDDTCANKACQHKANDSNPCVEGNACTVQEHCLAGACVTTPLDCDDGNACTADSCGYIQGNPAGGCIHTAQDIACEDGSLCTLNDTCVSGACTSGANWLACGDGNACTADSCVAATGCIHPFNSIACQDGDACTSGDKCQNGACVGGAAKVCDDGNPCTTDACVAIVGCVSGPIDGGSCDDNSLCTSGETCQAGQCTGGTTLNCSDGNPCTLDVCMAATGCSNPIGSGPCDDGDACTLNDFCTGGACKGTSDPTCTADAGPNEDAGPTADAGPNEDAADVAQEDAAPDVSAEDAQADGADAATDASAADVQPDVADAGTDAAAVDAQPDAADVGTDAVEVQPDTPDVGTDATAADTVALDAATDDAAAGTDVSEPEILGFQAQASSSGSSGSKCSAGPTSQDAAGWAATAALAALALLWRRKRIDQH